MRDVIGQYKFSADQYRAITKAAILTSEHAEKSWHRASHKFTVDEFVRMAKVGILNPDDRVELIDGVIVEMAPTGRPHGRRTHRLARLFGRLVPEEVEVSIQSTIRLSDRTAPEPDIALLTPEASLDEDNIPASQDILLIVEIADSSLRTDSTEKALRYAQSGIPELWIFVLDSDEIEVSREPTPEGYADVRLCRRGDTLTIQTLPDVRIAVDELLT